MTTIAMNTIDLHAATQLRATKESQKHIEELAFAFAEKGEYQELPWVGHIIGSNKYVPIDGFHRLQAVDWLDSEEYSKLDDVPPINHLDLKRVEVRLTEFKTMAEAIIAAAGVNATHGLKRQRGDIKNAIEAILEADRMRFMDGKYKLNKKAILSVVSCSSRMYEVETKEIRTRLREQRDLRILTLHDDGKSQREIANTVGASLTAINRLITGHVPKTQDAQTEHLGSEGVPKTQDAQTEQEQEASVFTHITTAEVVDNPWGEEPEDETDLSTPEGLTIESNNEVQPSGAMSDLELCTFLDSLTEAQRDLARNYLENI